MSKLTVAQAREIGRQIVARHPEGISYSAIVAEIKATHPITPHGTITGAVWDLDRRFPAEITKPQRGLFVPIGPLVLAEMTSAAARAGAREAEIAKVTGLNEATVRRKLGEGHGNKLVRNVFEEHWPTDYENSGAEEEHEVVDVDALGGMTSAAARGDEREGDISKVTGLTEAAVRRKLGEGHGKKLVRNVFVDHWPSHDEDEGAVDVDTLGEMTSAAARGDEREGDIAKVTGLTEAAVRRKLEEGHGKKLVRNVFADHWPSHDEEDDAADVDDPEAKSATAVRMEGRNADTKRVEKSKEADKRGPPPARPIAPTPAKSPKTPTAEPGQPTGPTQNVAVVRSPRIPKPLLGAYSSDKLAIFCGSGLSLGSDVKGRLPSWNQLPERLLDACTEYDTLDEEAVEAKKRRFKSRMSLEQMLSELGSLKTDLRRYYQAALNDIFRPPDATPGAAHRMIAELGARAVLTTNYDQLLELVREIPPRQVYTWKEASHAFEDLKHGRKVLLKVHGTAERHDTVVMSENEYITARSNRSYQSVLSYLLQDHMFLFVGYGMNDPLDLDLALKFNADAFKNAARQHYALLLNPSDADRDRYERDYNVRVIPYSNHDEVALFLKELAVMRASSTQR